MNGELEYGSILPNGDDWRLRKFDAGMGETEYRIFKNEKFFAQFDNRDDADLVMAAMTRPYQRGWDLLDEFKKWFETYCEEDEEADIYMYFFRAFFVFRSKQAGEQ